MHMKVSVVTAVYNRSKTIGRTIESFSAQEWAEKEQIVIDGVSTDDTLEIARGINSHETKIFSQPDTGLYDAINKGIKRATGDIIGLLHSDDYFASNQVLSTIAEAFEDPNLDIVYADASFFDEGNPKRTIRRFDSSMFEPDTIRNGWMPAHTTMYMRREVFDRYGLYRTNYKIAADFEFIARVFSSGHMNSRYVPQVWVMMQSGGISTAGLKSKFILNQEVLRACRENGIKTSYARILSKYPTKVLEYLRR